ncbi:MAG TPA: [FeFe] hydrogenase H-cluster radical SAM maturase HydE, partial [Candidatus Blautia pullistercoris]|nr:[FeFe] hydrogenase H-cluster radical SAM maturase HydE [Candidatus Blautia pullistercoris]
EILRAIRQEFPDCAITLSIGEKEKESYALFKEAGADRYLLRHETADEEHYRKLHPSELSLSHRINCLETLKELGYQTGAGIMVGSPGQTIETLIEDMEFLDRLQPEMVGIGPFIPHHDTPFKGEPQGGLELTLYLLSLIRLLLPRVLLPATTALGTIDPMGREMGVLAGANVVMPNLSPENVREKYLLYDNKIHTGKEAAECLDALRKSMKAIGYDVVVDRGDFLGRT